MGDVVDGGFGRGARHNASHRTLGYKTCSMDRAPGTDSIVFVLRGNDCDRSPRLQSTPGAESDPKLIRLLDDLAPDVGRTATKSAGHGHHCASPVMLRGVGYHVERRAIRSRNLNESFLLLLTFMISVSVPSLALSADVAVRQ